MRSAPIRNGLGAGLLAIAVAGCAASPSTPAGSEAIESASAGCAALSELACIDSAECTLRQVEGGYACTDPRSDCEIGFVQRGGRREDCAGEGCVYQPANCYCAPDVTCVCGGGPPAQCVAAS